MNIQVNIKVNIHNRYHDHARKNVQKAKASLEKM